MPPVARNTRSQTNKAKAAVGSRATTVMNKRNVDLSASPEEKQTTKRSAFGDLTNATNNVQSYDPKKTQHAKSKLGKTVKAEATENMQVDDDSILVLSLPSSQEVNDTIDASFKTASESTPDDHELSEQKSMIISPAADSTVDNNKSQEKGVNRVWPDVKDFDRENLMDPFSEAHYAMDIFNYYKEREVKFIIPDYMDKQRFLTQSMRAILVDWLVEVQESFELNHESLYLSVKLVDMYLSKKTVQKHKLQLVGAAAMLVAAKFDERSPPALDDFVYVCDDAYTRRELILAEIDLLKAVNFDLGIPLSYSFLRRYARCSKLPLDTLTLARYILEVALTDYQLLEVRDSCVAAAALMLALKMKKLPEWVTKTK